MTVYNVANEGMMISLPREDEIEIIKRQQKAYSITDDQASERLETAKKVIQSHISGKEVVSTGETPCADCGGTDFLRTGTCAVCVVCGSSQGCS